jgi:hypothetical protein
MLEGASPNAKGRGDRILPGWRLNDSLHGLGDVCGYVVVLWHQE